MVGRARLLFALHVAGLLKQLPGSLSTMILLLLGLLLNFDPATAREHAGAVVRVVLLRYAFGIGLSLLFWFALPFDAQVRGVSAVIALCPMSNVLVRYAVLFDYPPRLAASLVNLTTIISFFLLWLFTALVDIQAAAGGGGGP